MQLVHLGTSFMKILSFFKGSIKFLLMDHFIYEHVWPFFFFFIFVAKRGSYIDTSFRHVTYTLQVLILEEIP